MSDDIHMENGQSSENQPERNNHNTEQSTRQQDDAQKWFKDLRGSIMVVAVLVASATYTVGLSPPGGFWQDDLNGHVAGTPILRDKSPKRYTTFFYANATAFMASLVIIILLTNENVHKSKPKIVVLLITMVLDLVSMMIAYAAGCARSFHTSIYVIALAVVALVVVFFGTYFLKYTVSILPVNWIQPVLGKWTADYIANLQKTISSRNDRSVVSNTTGPSGAAV